MTAPPDTSRFSRIVFFTGAGLSKESGIATFRGAGGIWETYDYREVACQQALERDPDRVWDFHEHRRSIMREARPSLGHRIMAEVERARPETVVVTQNIDGLHTAAGSRQVVELHGSVWALRCDNPDCDRFGSRWEERRMPVPSRRCACGAWLRPDIVWFEDPLDPRTIDATIRAIEACDLFVSVGTSGVVYPAAEMPLLAHRAGATCVEVNPEPTPFSDQCDVVLRTGAAEALRALFPAEAAQAEAR